MSDLLDDLSPSRRRALEKMRDEAMASSEREEFEHGPAMDWNTPSPDPEGDENAAHEAGLTHGAQLDSQPGSSAAMSRCLPSKQKRWRYGLRTLTPSRPLM